MNKLTILLFAIFALSASAFLIPTHAITSELQSLWHSWKQLHNKVYAEAEEMEKFAVFVENYIKVITHNAENADFKMALNRFADLTPQEWKAKYTGLRLTQKDKEEIRMRQAQRDFLNVDYSVLGVPDSIDWREKGAVTPVKDQSQCGSCWAFSSTGALEGLNFIKSGKLESYSEQQLVDCETEDQGCDGGLMVNAFAYTAKNGIETEKDYPYTARDGKCKYAAAKAQHINKAYQNVPVNNVDAMKAALAVQPVSVAIQADEAAFQFYHSGVIKSGCGAELDHGVLAVGYGTFSGTEAFIVKNSWDSSWGDKGYVLISTDGKANNGAGVCGILAMSTVPTA